MLNRLTYGAAAVAAIFAVILADAFISDHFSRLAVRHAEIPALRALAELLGRGSLVPLLFALLTFGGAWELARLMQAAGLRPMVRWAVAWSVVLMLAPWLINGLLTPHYPADFSGAQWQLAMVALALAGTALGVLPRRELSGALPDLAATWAIIVYTGFLGSFALHLRCHHFLYGADGAWLILIFIAVVKVSDIGAFFVGSALGRRRLIPWVSPNKSVEGAIGGVLSSVAVAMVFWRLHDWTRLDLTTPPTAVGPEAGAGQQAVTLGDRLAVLLQAMTDLFHSLTITQVIVFAILMSVVGQLGDLLESVFKRSAGAKDSAHLLPGFGGVLDIIDSPVLAAPVAWILLTCIWEVV